MALVNRDKDASEQKEVMQWVGATQINTGFTSWIGVVPYPCVIQSAQCAALGVSGAMQVAFSAQRFAAGNTVIGLGISNMILNSFGTSGILGYSGLAATGSTLLQLLAGDVLMITTSVANSAAANLAVQLVLKKTQDIVSYNGIST